MELETLEALSFRILKSLLSSNSLTWFWASLSLETTIYVHLCPFMSIYGLGNHHSTVQRWRMRAISRWSFSRQASVDCREAVCDAEMWMSCLPSQVWPVVTCCCCSFLFIDYIQSECWLRIRKLEVQGPSNSYSKIHTNLHYNRLRVP